MLIYQRVILAKSDWGQESSGLLHWVLSQGCNPITIYAQCLSPCKVSFWDGPSTAATIFRAGTRLASDWTFWALPQPESQQEPLR